MNASPLPARRRILFWIAYSAAWTALGIWEGSNVIIGHRNSGQPIAAWEPMTWELSSAALMAVLAVLVYAFERRFPLSGTQWLRRLPLHLPAAIAFSALHTLGMVGIRKCVYAIEGRYYDFGDAWLGFAYELQKDLVSYAVIVGACIALRAQRLRRERELAVIRLERDLSEARLAQLTAQIEPHFMFNTLNAISNRMHEDVEAADRMIAAFADLLRAALAESGSAHVRVADDVVWLERYFDLMRERFRGRLETSITLDPNAGAARIPRLLLQPLVENAFEHGLKNGRGRVEVVIRADGDRLRCTVDDDAGQEPKCREGQGGPGAAAGQEPKCREGHGWPGAAAGQEPKCREGHGWPGASAGQEPKCREGQGGPGAAAGQEPKCREGHGLPGAVLGHHGWSGETGAGCDAGFEPGTGLANVRSRLELLYANDHTFRITARAGCGTCVEIDLPLVF